MRVLASLALALVVGTTTAWLTAPRAASAGRTSVGPAEAAPPVAPDPRLGPLAERLRAVGRAAEARTLPRRRAADLGLERAITVALEPHGLRVDPAALEAGRAAAEALRTERLRLVDDALAAGDALALAQRFEALADEGAVDEVLDALRARVEADPEDVAAATALAHAAAAAMDASGYGPRAAGYGGLAADALGQALAAAPARDDLRLERARVLARAPAFLGRRSEALEEARRVVDAGEATGTPRAEAYALLGTLLLEQGARGEAVDAWRRGAGTFPDDEGLRRLLELHAD